MLISEGHGLASPKAHTCPSASPISKSSLRCSPSLTSKGQTLWGKKKDGEAKRAQVLHFNSGSLT